MEIKVTLDASPQFLNALLAIAGALGAAPKEKGTNGKAKNPDAIVAKLEPTIPDDVVAPLNGVASKDKVETKVKVFTIEDVRALVREKSQEGKKDAVKALFAEFDTDSVTNLAEAKYSEFMEKLKAL